MNIEILQPKPFDLVGSQILIAGNAVGFEGTLQIEVTDGHDSIEAIAMAGSLAIRPFQTQIDVPDEATFPSTRLFVTVKDEGGSDEGPVSSVTVPVIYAARFFETFAGWREYSIQPGDTLTSIAASQLGDGSLFHILQQANPHIIADADVIFVGQTIRIPIE